MRRLVIEVISLCAAAAFGLAAIRMVSPDENVAFFIALIGSLAVWEAVRFALIRLTPKTKP